MKKIIFALLISNIAFGATCTLKKDLTELIKTGEGVSKVLTLSLAKRDNSKKKWLIEELEKSETLIIHIMEHDDVSSELFETTNKMLREGRELKEALGKW